MEKQLEMTYSVRKQSPQQALSIEVLSLLYQPIISADAQALYLLLWSEGQQLSYRTHTHHELSRALNMDETHLQKAFLKLEGMGLLQSFYKKTGDTVTWLYQLHLPVTAQQFFNDSLLTFALCDYVGETRAKELKQYFNILQTVPHDYKEETAPFQEVYYISEEQYQKNTFPVEQKKEYNPRDLTAEERTWFNQWIVQIDEEVIDKENIISEKEVIINAKRLYHFSDQYLLDLLYAAIDVQTGKLRVNKWQSLVLKAGKTFNRKAHVMPSKEDLPQKENQGVTKEEKVFQVAQQLSPMQFLQSIKQQKKGIVTSQEQFLLKELVEQENFSTTYMNLITYFLLVIKQEHELPRSLYERLANRISEKQCATCQEVWQLLPLIANELKPNYQKAKHEKKVIRPEWEEKKTHSKEENKITLESLDQQLKAIRQMEGSYEKDQ